MKNIIYGFHSIIALANKNPDSIITIYLDEKRKDKRQQELINIATDKKIKVELTNNLDVILGTVKHQGVGAKLIPMTSNHLKLDDYLLTLQDKKSPLILILDGITDPQNLGAIIRSADCFGVDGLIIPKDNSATYDNPIVAKSSSGAVNTLPIFSVNNICQTIDKLKEAKFWIAGTSLSDKSVSLFEFNYNGPLVWIMGNEATGMRRLVSENCDYLVTIPMFGNTQSLNVSVATGVVLSYTRFMQQKLIK